MRSLLLHPSTSKRTVSHILQTLTSFPHPPLLNPSSSSLTALLATPTLPHDRSSYRRILSPPRCGGHRRVPFGPSSGRRAIHSCRSKHYYATKPRTLLFLWLRKWW
ncbi:hypothetical protein V8G54_026205 [Vigna mungo]|uniref:Uncharacterized protein n=1 Tax=Vigna mungo TaxID=3915 RepID=A0AAQ3RQA5_VIGMU